MDVQQQDVRDLSTAMGDAGSLAIGWLIAAALLGSLDLGWPELDHERSRFGASRVVRTWLVGWPFGRVLSQLVEVVVSGGAVDLFEPRADAVAEAVAYAAGDALGLLVVMVWWRRALLQRWTWW